MANSVGTIVAEVVAKVCTSHDCPYRYGDAAAIKKKLGERLDQKLKHRLADGNEVRVLEERVAKLEKTLRMCASRATSGLALSSRELEEVKDVLKKKT